MQFTRNTSSSKRATSLILKLGLVLILFFVAIFLLSKVEFPAPKKEIEKLFLMKILKLLNNKYLSILLIIFLIVFNVKAEQK